MSTRELFEYDSSLDFALIAGIDEAGRGPLAGPVVCASCIMPLDDMIDGINDSKKIGEKTTYLTQPKKEWRNACANLNYLPE